MVEMTEAAAILHQATPNSLVLMDEIGRGTSLRRLSLAGAIAKELAVTTKSYTLLRRITLTHTALPPRFLKLPTFT